MAGAPLKRGIEFIYFHLTDDIDILDHMILELGSDRAEVVFNRLRADIGKKQGYFMKWGNQELIRFAYNYRFHKEDHELINLVVEYLLGIDYFDNKVYTSHGILTSTQIQNHYFSVSERRQQIDFNPEYLCPGIEELITRILTKKAKKAESKNQEIEENVSAQAPEIEPLKTYPKTLDSPLRINVDINSNKCEQESELLSTGIQNNADNNSIKERKGNESKGKESKDFIILHNEEFTEIGLGLDSEKLEVPNPLPKEPDKPPESNNVSVPLEDDPIGAEKKESSGGRAKKPKHGARDAIIEKWKSKFETVHTNDYEPNVAINHICKHLENHVKANGYPPEQYVNEILRTWDHILSRWNLLDDYYSKQISFVSIKKNLENIIYQIKEREKNGGNKNSGKQGIAATRQVETGKPFRSSRTSDK